MRATPILLAVIVSAEREEYPWTIYTNRLVNGLNSDEFVSLMGVEHSIEDCKKTCVDNAHCHGFSYKNDVATSVSGCRLYTDIDIDKHLKNSTIGSVYILTGTRAPTPSPSVSPTTRCPMWQQLTAVFGADNSTSWPTPQMREKPLKEQAVYPTLSEDDAEKERLQEKYDSKIEKRAFVLLAFTCIVVGYIIGTLISIYRSSNVRLHSHNRKSGRHRRGSHRHKKHHNHGRRHRRRS